MPPLAHKQGGAGVGERRWPVEGDVRRVVCHRPRVRYAINVGNIALLTTTHHEGSCTEIYAAFFITGLGIDRLPFVIALVIVYSVYFMIVLLTAENSYIPGDVKFIAHNVSISCIARTITIFYNSKRVAVTVVNLRGR